MSRQLEIGDVIYLKAGNTLWKTSITRVTAKRAFGNNPVGIAFETCFNREYYGHKIIQIPSNNRNWLIGEEYDTKFILQEEKRAVSILLVNLSNRLKDMELKDVKILKDVLLCHSYKRELEVSDV